MSDYYVPTEQDEHEAVERWFNDQHAQADLVSNEVWSLSGRWFDFEVTLDQVAVVYESHTIAFVDDMDAAAELVYEKLGLDNE